MRTLAITELDAAAQALAERVLGDYTPPPPFWIWAQSMDLAEHVEPLGAYCRKRSHLPARLRELSVLIVGRHNRSPFAWWAHYESAIDAGVPRECLDRLAAGQDPAFRARDEDVAHRFATTVLERHVVGDELFEEAKAELGIEGLVDLLGCMGSFSMSAWGLNVFKLGLDDDTPWPYPDTAPS
ncbi:MAG: carboxymuconolactone decarboxylase family protein [Bifidobacteriaceae bacterium]|jgi:4-carboxymuconolactone decarboxylase|nr:carboxymuconolactone decarboxylase family protein [Bifidobacteriaceae bacterium]